ncbi:nucleoside triphosphatase YtkD [Ferrimonas sediminum]|uniref:phosphoglycolate phosphatase n=1 Tax=Ferrimonas sediminum TaxID=718193 RepID=A0A1G8N599_9GAMM|nr:HAD hydrolase-like protein [Ferrimonas sediminum]SDI75374.1 nucleoside triphosphatase YtkD [Ferrimonas sediminum]
MTQTTRVDFHNWQPQLSNTLKFVVIMARYRQQWLLVRHHQRDTLEIPGGKIDTGETPIEAARRELYEETGATDFTLTPMEIYRVCDGNSAPSFGLLLTAEIRSLSAIPKGSEIAEVYPVTRRPQDSDMTWPAIQPRLFDHVTRRHQLLEQLGTYQHVIWDWNGTLVDDAPLATDIVNRLMASQNLGSISLEQYRNDFCHPVIDYYQGLGFDFNRLPFDQLCQQFGQHYRAAREQLKLHNGSRFLLRSLSRSHTQSLLSASAQHSLEQCISHHQLDGLFDYLYGLDNHHAACKIDRGRELLQVSGIAPERTLVIGDTDHDWEVADALGTHLWLIADGHQSEAKLGALHGSVFRNWQQLNLSEA